MRLLALICVAALAGCVGTAREEGFAETGPAAFLYSAQTNTVMTPTTTASPSVSAATGSPTR